MEITAPSRALPSLYRGGRDQRALISGNKNVTTPDRAPAYREGVNMTKPTTMRTGALPLAKRQFTENAEQYTVRLTIGIGRQHKANTSR